MKRLAENWEALSRRDKFYYWTVIAGVPAIVVSVITKGFFLTRALASIFNLYTANDSNLIYLEFLFGTMLITIVQLFKYHAQSMEMYDIISIRGARSSRMAVHDILQIGLVLATFVAFLVIFLAVLIELYKWDIRSDYNIMIEDIIGDYLAWSNVKFLLLYFLLMDICILGLNFNYCSTGQCDDVTKNKMIFERAQIRKSIYGALIVFIFEIIFIRVVSSDSSQAFRPLHSGAGMIDTAPIIFVLGMQALYVFFEVSYRMEGAPASTGLAVSS